MKLFIKLMIFIVFIACLGPFLLKGPDGESLLSIKNIRLPAVPSWSEFINKGNRMTNKGYQQSLEVYKWVDKNGVTHYSDKDDSHHHSTRLTIQPINVLSVSKPKPEATEIKMPSTGIGLTTIPLPEIPKLIEDARQVKKQMEGRDQQIESALSRP